VRPRRGCCARADQTLFRDPRCLTIAGKLLRPPCRRLLAILRLPVPFGTVLPAVRASDVRSVWDDARSSAGCFARYCAPWSGCISVKRKSAAWCQDRRRTGGGYVHPDASEPAKRPRRCIRPAALERRRWALQATMLLHRGSMIGSALPGTRDDPALTTRRKSGIPTASGLVPTCSSNRKAPQ